MCSWVNCDHPLPGAPMASTNYPKLRLVLNNIPSEWWTTSPWIYPSGTNQTLQSYQLMLGHIRLGPLLMGRICERRIFDLWRTILFVPELAYIFFLQEKINGAVGVERIKKSGNDYILKLQCQKHRFGIMFCVWHIDFALVWHFQLNEGFYHTFALPDSNGEQFLSNSFPSDQCGGKYTILRFLFMKLISTKTKWFYFIFAL